MADSPNQPGHLPSDQQPPSGTQLISVSSAAVGGGTFQPVAVARPGTPVLIRPTTSTPLMTTGGPARNLVLIRQAGGTPTAIPSQAPRIIVQTTRPTAVIAPQTAPITAAGILPQMLTATAPSMSTVSLTSIPSPSLDNSNDSQPDVGNAPVATILRNAPISMRFDPGQGSGSATAVPIRAMTRPGMGRGMNRSLGPGSGAAAAARLRAQAAASSSASSTPPEQRKVVREMQVSKPYTRIPTFPLLPSTTFLFIL